MSKVYWVGFIDESPSVWRKLRALERIENYNHQGWPPKVGDMVKALRDDRSAYACALVEKIEDQ